MTRRLTAAVIPVVLGALVAGCAGIDSAKIRTDGIEAHISVTVDEGTRYAQVETSMRVGTLKFVDLDDADQLVATTGDRSLKLSEHKVLGHTGYSGRFEGVTQPGTKVNVALQRSGDNPSAPHSVVTLPEPVRLTSPTTGSTFSRSKQDITVRVEGAPWQSPLDLEWTGACITTGRVTVPPGQTQVRIAKRDDPRREPRGQPVAEAGDLHGDPDAHPLDRRDARPGLRGRLDHRAHDLGAADLVDALTATGDRTTPGTVPAHPDG